jgi:hypothetical protein
MGSGMAIGRRRGDEKSGGADERPRQYTEQGATRSFHELLLLWVLGLLILQRPIVIRET